MKQVVSIPQETGQPGSHVSIDTAILTAQRLVHLRFEDAQATNPADKAPCRTATWGVN